MEQKLRNLTVFENSMWKVKVSLREGNPPFWALLLVGFVTDKSKPSNYSKLVGVDFSEIDIESLKGDDCIVSDFEYVGLLNSI